MPQNPPPPADIQAERSVLSAILCGHESPAELDQVVKPTEFYDPRHVLVAQCCWDMSADGCEIDAVTVGSRLRTIGKLDAAGGVAYLAELLDEVAAVANVPRYAAIVADKARVRRVQEVARKIVAGGYSADNVDDWVRKAEADFFAATENHTAMNSSEVIGDTVATECANLEESSKTGETPGISIGWRDVDRYMGRLIAGNQYVIAGRPGMGKTAFALGACIQVARHHNQCSIFLSLEMPKPQLALRAISHEGMIDSEILRSGVLKGADWDLVANARMSLHDMPLAIDDTPGLSIAGVRSAITRCLSRLRRRGHDMPLGLVVVDYLQLMKGSQKGGNREAEVSECSRGLKEIAKEFKCAVMPLSQLNRSVESRTDKRPTMADLRESGAIEQDADSIAMLYRDCYYNPNSESNEVEVIVRKNRHGGLGTAMLKFVPENTRLYTIERDDGFNDFDSHDYDQ